MRTESILRRVLVAGLCLAPLAAIAAPGTLAQQPLFLGTRTESNIVFVVDDSGSMDWEVMTRDFGHDGLFAASQPDGSNPADAGAVKQRDANDDGVADCGFNSGDFYGYLYGVEFASNVYTDDSNDCNTADDEAWRFRTAAFNKLYFDPAKSYTPWAGVDVNGAAFGNIDITHAPNDPYNPTEYIDLTRNNSNALSGGARTTSDRNGDGQPDGFRYYTWTDLDGDGRFDNGEQTEHLISQADAATQQNFANWFSYYRSRMLAAKAAYGRVIAEAENVRMGLVTMNSSTNRVAVSSVSGDPAAGSKRQLLNALYSLRPNGSTPLRSAFYQTGQYLACASNSLFSSCPALSEAQGGSCQQNFAVVMTDGFYNGSFSGLGNKDGDNNTAWDGGAYADSRSNTLADIAMYFYERDLQPSLPNEVPITRGVDEADHQHVVTYTVAFGVDGTLSAMPVDASTAFNWPNPSSGDAEKIDDLRHAAYNGRGLFLNASDPEGLQSSLSDAISDIAERSGSAAAVAFNTTSLQTDTVLYLSLFNSTRWSGNLYAYPLDADGQLQSTAQWDAAARLDARDLTATPRTILTFDGSDGIPFRWDSLTAAEQADLHINPVGGTDSDAIAQARLDYLRGARDNEGSGYGFRIRSSRLGDIVYSAPVYVGKPEMGWPDSGPFAAGGALYSAFKSAHAGRTPVVYVGANDGMLHGFRADTGAEAVAYVPGLLYSSSAKDGLHYLTDPTYVHRYYVDMTPTVADVVLQNGWKTVLVGGLRGGGRGYYALNVTDPATFGENAAAAQSTVLWEFSDADLGYSYSRPAVVMLNNGRWAAVFGNGYNDTGSGQAQLYILFLDGGLDGTWTAGTDYIKVTTASGSATDRNGLATPAVIDLDSDGVADRVYAGDLKGNLWAFDLSSNDPSNWKVAYKQGTTPKPLFTAPSGQPITTTPEVVRNTSVTTTTGNAPNLLVLFGTGQYLVNGDVLSTTTQSFYDVWDAGKSQLAATDLVQQAITTTGTTRTLSDNAVNFSNTTYGCYVDLPDSGERVVTDPIVRGDLVYFNSLVPSGAVCTPGGTGWLMAMKYASCHAPSADQVVDAGDYVDAPPSEPRFLSYWEYISTSDGNSPVVVREVERLDDSTTGRLSWQELLKQ